MIPNNRKKDSSKEGKKILQEQLRILR